MFLLQFIYHTLAYTACTYILCTHGFQHFSNLHLTHIRPCPLVLPVPPALLCTHVAITIALIFKQKTAKARLHFCAWEVLIPCQPSAADEALHWPKHVLGSEWLYITPRPILYFSEMWFVDSSCFYYTVRFASTFNSLFFFTLLGQQKATHLQISPSQCS